MATALHHPHEVRPTQPAEHKFDLPQTSIEYSPEAEVNNNFVNRLDTLLNGSQLVEAPEHLGTEKFREGYLEHYGFVTSDGYAYDGVVGLPENPTSDIPILATYAWFT